VIPAFIRKAINHPIEDFVVWGSGEQGRAFFHVNEVVDALMMTREKGLGKGMIQIGPSVCTSILEIVETVVKVSGKNITITYDVTKPEGDKPRSADYLKAKHVHWDESPLWRLKRAFGCSTSGSRVRSTTLCRPVYGDIFQYCIGI
jgi:nucleoside-diphosphate-sugar epimerase